MIWREAVLQDVADWSSGGTPQAGNPAYYEGSIPWAVIGDLNDGLLISTRSTITEAGLANSAAKVVPTGTILVAMYGSIGKLGIAGRPMATNQAIATAQPRDVIDSKFLFYYLLSQRQSLDAAGKGATQRNISQAILRPWPIRFPDNRDEQRRVVAVLEDHLSRVDAGDSSLAAARRGLDVTQMAWLSAIRRGLRDEPQMTIGRVADTTLGKMLDAKRQVGQPTPYLRNINVRWGSFDLANVKSTALTERDIERYDVRSGDLMVCEGGEPGRCAVWRHPLPGLAFQKALHRIRIKTDADVLPEFLALMLTEAIQSGRCDRLFTGTTIKHLPQEKLRLIEVPVPERAKQQAILRASLEFAAQRDRLAAAADRAAARSRALRRSLLADAFSGRLTAAGLKDGR